MKEQLSYDIEFEIKGISPLKMDRWVDGIQPKNEEGYKKQAEQKVYRDKKGNLAIPSCAIKASMRLASSEIGKKMEAKKNRQTIQSAMFIEQEFLSIGKKKFDCIVEDIVTRKGTGDKVTRVRAFRPQIKEWTAKGIITSYGVPFEFLQDCMSLAGMRFGLLSHRPQFGRFVITKFEKVN